MPPEARRSPCCLTKKAEPPGTCDMKPLKSLRTTDSANPGWLRRLVRHRRMSKTEYDTAIQQILRRRQDVRMLTRNCLFQTATHFRKAFRFLQLLVCVLGIHTRDSAKLCVARCVCLVVGWRPIVGCNVSCDDGVNVGGVTMPNKAFMPQLKSE